MGLVWIRAESLCVDGVQDSRAGDAGGRRIQVLGMRVAVVGQGEDRGEQPGKLSTYEKHCQGPTAV